MESDFGVSGGAPFEGMFSRVSEYMTARNMLIVALIIIVVFLYYKYSKGSAEAQPAKASTTDAADVLTNLEKSGAVVVSE